MFENESLGTLKLEQRANVVTTALGKPNSKSKEVHWEAIGQWVQEWDYRPQGIVMSMGSDKKGGDKTILNITAEAPCKLATSRGIKIGSTEAELTKAYADVWNKEASEAGKTFVAGSVYGGAIFTLKGGKVAQIFVGAAAE